MSARRVFVTGWLLAPMLLIGTLAYAQSPFILMPGQVYDNVPAAGFVEKRTHTRTAIFDASEIQEESFVAFGRRGEATQIMKVYAWSKGGWPIGAEAIGQLRLTFCVPRPGFSTCDEISDPTARDIAVKITFGYGIVGLTQAFGLGSKAEFNAAARVIDLERGKEIGYQNLDTLSASTGRKVEILKIPVPIPDYEMATVTSPVAFSLALKRGRRYQFQLRARAYANWWDGTFVQTPFGYANTDMSTDLNGLVPEGFVSLRDLSFEVSPALDLSSLDLLEIIRSLQEQLGSLAAELDALRAGLLERSQAGSCTTGPPALDWVCVNGGWVPPGHPSAGGGSVLPEPPVPPPSAPSACPGVAPATGWVCVNGGWVPPDHPLARGGGSVPPAPPAAPPPGACAGVAPASGWVCVKGGWVPPGHPLAGGG